MLLAEAIKKFLDHQQTRKLSSRHIRHLRTRLGYFVNFVGNKELSQITPQDCRNFLLTSHCQKLARGTYNHYVSVIRRLFSFCQDFGLATENPARTLEFVREPQAVIEYLTVSEARKLLKCRYPYKNRRAFLQRRDRLAWHLGILCGLRMSELRNLRWENVNLEYREITVIASKNLKDRIIPLVPAVYNLLRQEKKRRKPKPTDFVVACQKGRPANHEALNDSLRRSLKYLGIKKKNPHFHMLRHTCATLFLRGRKGQRGMDIRLVAELLGHSDVSTTQKYTHVDKSFLREEMKRTTPI